MTRITMQKKQVQISQSPRLKLCAMADASHMPSLFGMCVMTEGFTHSFRDKLVCKPFNIVHILLYLIIFIIDNVAHATFTPTVWV